MRTAGIGRHTRGVAQPAVAPTTLQRITRLLISLGRDREAAELADTLIGDDRPDSRGGPMDVRSQLDELGPLLAGVVGGITPDQLANPTPCTDFDVRGVLEHMIGGATAFAAGFRGVEPTTPDLRDVLAAFGPALTELAASITAPGALDRTIQAPFGEVPGETFARFVVMDGLVHGWDIATATGQAYDPPAAVVAEADAFGRQAIADGMRDGDTFKAAVEPPAGASQLVKLVAFTGREV
jgi:uncharacterized protein (TIGR03086 family)